VFIILSELISSRKPKGCPDPRWKHIPWQNKVNNLTLSLYLQAHTSAVAEEKSI